MLGQHRRERVVNVIDAAKLVALRVVPAILADAFFRHVGHDGGNGGVNEWRASRRLRFDVCDGHCWLQQR